MSNWTLADVEAIRARNAQRVADDAARRNPGRHFPASHDGGVGEHARAAVKAVNAEPAPGGHSVGEAREPRQPSRGNKYGAIRTTAPASWGGTRLADSRAGAELARTMDALKASGAIIDWWEEISIPIGVDERGKVIRYRADAVALLGYTDCGAMVIRAFDAKSAGMDTRTSAAKRAALRNRGFNVEVIEKGCGIGLPDPRTVLR